MIFIQQIAAEKRALAWYMRTYRKFSFRRIAEECGISKSSARRICSNEFGNGSESRIMTRSEEDHKMSAKERCICLFTPRRLFVMDNDPSQTSRAAKLALEDIEGTFHEIPPQSPDLNPSRISFILLLKSGGNIQKHYKGIL